MADPSAQVQEMADEPAEAKQQPANKNGKKAEGGAGGSFFTWFMVLALLGVWTSVAVVWFDLVDYQGVVGKLGSYDVDNDGDFDLEDVQVMLDIDANIDSSIPETFSNLSEEASGLLFGFFTAVYDIMTPFEIEDEEEVSVATKDVADEKPEEVAEEPEPRERSPLRDPAGKLKEALKRQLAMIHERVEAKKIARLALAELRRAVAKEGEERRAERAAEAALEEATVKAEERKEAKLRKVVEKMEREEAEQEMKAKAKAKREKERAEKEKEKEKGEDKKAASKRAERRGGDKDDDDKAGKKGGKRAKEAKTEGAKEKRKTLKDSGKEG